MRGNTIRRILVALIIVAPIISYTGCRKQAQCGCGKDVLSTLVGASAYIYWQTSASISFQIVGDVYSTYNFCNPTEMFPKLSENKSGDILQISGQVYWNCTYVYQSSNSSYQSLYRVYDVQVTDVFVNLYGKNNPASGIPLDSAKPVN
jgi:hypothetical protein